MKKALALALLGLLSSPFVLQSQSIGEKRNALKSSETRSGQTSSPLDAIRLEIAETKRALSQVYNEAEKLSDSGISPNSSDFAKLREEALILHARLESLQNEWKQLNLDARGESPFTSLHAPETSVGQLLIDYGSPDRLYIIPPEVAELKVSLGSELLIPQEEREEVLKLILSELGLDIRELNPYVCKVYPTRQALGTCRIVTDEKQLDVIPPSEKVFFIFQATDLNPSHVQDFFERFANPALTAVQKVGRHIYLIAKASEIKELVRLYRSILSATGGVQYKVITLTKIAPKEMESLLVSMFLDPKEHKESSTSNSSSLFKVFTLSSLPSSLFLYGTADDIEKATQVISTLEQEVENPDELIVHWYTCKHSEPEELAKTLSQVYKTMQNLPSEGHHGLKDKKDADRAQKSNLPTDYVSGTIAVKTDFIQSAGEKSSSSHFYDPSFIVDQKTGSIIMVVQQELLPKLKNLIKKLDVPKKMVQIEVLLFEKKIASQSRIGLNLLNMGSNATNTNAKGISWNDPSISGKGILEFTMSHARGGGLPAYDLAYQFLLAQEDVQINSCPSVVTVNQTPARIAIVDEISINAGYVQSEYQKDIIAESYVRAQYGTIIEITPTINASEDEEFGKGFITLSTDITFDSTKASGDGRPDVTRRNVKNEVRVADGETVVIGGLRRKTKQDSKDMVPFLGELPGIGKFFGTTDMTDSQVEMFVFITPKIIGDSDEDMRRIRDAEVRKRPGDIPEFLECVVQAEREERNRFMQQSMEMLLGRQEDISSQPKKIAEYEGR